MGLAWERNGMCELTFMQMKPDYFVKVLYLVYAILKYLCLILL
jgi:hypothetical protein